MFFRHFFIGRQLLWLSFCFSVKKTLSERDRHPFRKGSTFKGQILLLEEQILSFESWPLGPSVKEAKMTMAEVPESVSFLLDVVKYQKLWNDGSFEARFYYPDNIGILNFCNKFTLI